jgi:hypothetical protein
MHTLPDGGVQLLVHSASSAPVLHSQRVTQSLQPEQLSAVLQPAGRTGGVLSTGGVVEQLVTHSS